MDDDSIDSDDEEKDMLDQLKSRFNSQMSSFKTKWGNSNSGQVAKLKKQANKEYLEENMQRMKSNKRHSIKDQAMSDNGVIEEYIFVLP